MEKGTFIDSRDGKIYRTVVIGKQTWMAENLNYEIEGSKCFDNDPANCQKYGQLYDWETAKKACPPGWHLPSNEEWQELVTFAGDYKIAGKKLKATSGWASTDSTSGNGTDDYGFAALPGGGFFDGNFLSTELVGHWWSASDDSTGCASIRRLLFSSDRVNVYNHSKSCLYSVRCLQD